MRRAPSLLRLCIVLLGLVAPPRAASTAGPSGPAGPAGTDDDERRERARALGKALLAKDELDGSGDAAGWSFAVARVAADAHLVLAVKNQPEPAGDGEEAPAFPVARAGLFRGGKLVSRWTGQGRKMFRAIDRENRDYRSCDNGLEAVVEPVDVGGKQHVAASIRCSYGEDCWGSWVTTVLFRVEPDAAGKPASLAQAWLGRGSSAYIEDSCAEQDCLSSTKVSFALSPDGKKLLIQSADELLYTGDKKNQRRLRACKPHPPVVSTKEAPYPLAPGGLPAIAAEVLTAGPEGAILDDKTPPDKAAALARGALRLDAAARHAHAVAANTRGFRLYQAARHAEALPLFAAAAELDKTYGMPRYNAARCHAHAGDAAAAVRYLQELKAIGKSQKSRLAQAEKDEAFQKIAQDPSFQALFR